MHGDIVVVLATIGVAGELLASILDPAHRMTQLPCEPGRAHFFRQQDALVAEAAADIGRDDADAPLVEPKASGKPGAHDVRQSASSCRPAVAPAVGPRSRPHRGLRAATCIAAPCATAAAPRSAPAAQIAPMQPRRRSPERRCSSQCSCSLRFAGERRAHVDHRRQFVEVHRRPTAARSSAAARLSATQTAIASPTWRTLSVASTG